MSPQVKLFLAFGDMKYEVQLYVGGTVFYETVQATNYQDAKETALARNPKAKVVSVNVSFK